MDKEELFSRAKDPKYIPGIYNYCDRVEIRFPNARAFVRPGLDDPRNE